jgi:threonine dehydratase
VQVCIGSSLRSIDADNLGNHAQGVALSSNTLKIPAIVVMPVSTPSIKWRNVARLGAQVVLHGSDFDAAKAECLRLAKEKQLTFIPPYDDPYIVAGQGTIAMEITRQIKDCDELDGIFGSIGGGGMMSGIAAYVKRVAKPSVGVYGVETHDGDAMEKSLGKGKRVMLDEVGPFADGTAVRIVGEEPFRVCKELLDGIVKVGNDEICAAIKDVFEGQSRVSSILLMWIRNTHMHYAYSIPLSGTDVMQKHVLYPNHLELWPSLASKPISFVTTSRARTSASLRSSLAAT